MRRSDQGTEGILSINDFKCFTLELPWRDNQRGISCIPSGEYKVKIAVTPKHGRIYKLQNVPGRTYVLIHSGNYAGDINKGYKTHVQGCILLGEKIGAMQGQLAILNSRLAIRRFMNYLNNQNFNLIIHESF